MMHRFIVVPAVLLVSCLALARATPSAAQPPDVDLMTIHVRMEAVILSDDNGANPTGVLTLKQLKQWIGNENESLRASSAHIVVDFDAAHDLARVKNSIINHLAHNNDRAASKQAAKYQGKMVVFFRAYGPAGSGIGVTGNGYTAYNAYVPVGSTGCSGSTTTDCSASYTVMPSVYCGTTVATDPVDSSHPNPPIASDGSGCTYAPSSWYVYQNFSQLSHEVGHYFGLPHTFPGTFDFLSTPAALQSWYDGNPRSGTTRSIKIYDGDSPAGPLISDGTNLTSGWTFTVTDTPPDAGAHLFNDNNIGFCHPPTGKTLSDGSGATIVFNGPTYTLHALFSGKPVSLTFRPDKNDVMSYFICRKPMLFTRSQVATMRRNLMQDPQRSYLLCTNPQDVDLKPYTNCPKAVPHIIYPHPRIGPTSKPGGPITQF